MKSFLSKKSIHDAFVVQGGNSDGVREGRGDSLKKLLFIFLLFF